MIITINVTKKKVFWTAFLAILVFTTVQVTNVYAGYQYLLKEITNTTNIEVIENKILLVEETQVAELHVMNMNKAVVREVTMYSSTPEQTDSSPCVGASINVCEAYDRGENLCATNAFPQGSKLLIDKLGECIVFDTMNSRYTNRIDWYAGYDKDCLDGIDVNDNCPNYRRAIQFGKQSLLVENLVVLAK